MKIHKEGFASLVFAIIIFALITLGSYFFISGYSLLIAWLVFVVSFALLVFLFSFFRVPNRQYTSGGDSIIAPCDGTVVVIEEVEPDEYFKDRRLQLSIFMSPLNVHVNRNPVSGAVTYSQYHKGKYLVYHREGKELLVKQIAGALAKRIVNYLKPGDEVIQGNEMGFIKFGSRVDLLLPLEAKIEVNIHQKVKGGVTVLARW
jgi:phosphatidylserine decarboxylase